MTTAFWTNARRAPFMPGFLQRAMARTQKINFAHCGIMPAPVGFEVFREYTDIGVSGAKESREGLDKLMADARRRRFDAVVVARFDRFARSTKHLVLALEEFQALGIDFISLSESVDTSTPMGKMVFTVISAVAELERALIRERVKMGLERARKARSWAGRKRP